MTQFILDDFLLALNYELYCLFEDKSKTVNELYEGFCKSFYKFSRPICTSENSNKKGEEVGNPGLQAI